MKILKLIAAVGLFCFAGQAQADLIDWGPGPLPLAGVTDILNNGTHVAAVNRGGFAETINGVNFSADGGGTTTHWTGNGGASTTDAALDRVLNTHTTLATGANPGLLTLTGLVTGNTYQIQLIGIHDLRGCCATRNYSIGNGAGADSGFNLARNAGGSGGTGSLLGTMVGTFTHNDGTGTQAIQIGGFPGDSIDPGLSGFVLRDITAAIPEPSSLVLGIFGIGLLSFVRKRRS